MAFNIQCVLIIFWVWLCIGCGPSKKRYSVDEHPIDALSIQDKSIFWVLYPRAHRLREEYAKRMTLLDEQTGMVTDSSIYHFCALFEPTATIWNDIHPEPFPVSPSGYTSFVKNFLPKGVDCSMEIDKNSYDNQRDKRYFRYYRVGAGENEYYLHFTVKKCVRVGLTTNMTPRGYAPPGKEFLLDFVVHLDYDKNYAKIADIKPLLN